MGDDCSPPVDDIDPSPVSSRAAKGSGCTTLKWNRWRDVGQAGSLRATQRVPRLPPLSAAIAAVGRLTIGRSLPSCPTGAPPAWRTTYAQMQALLPMNRVYVHFCVVHPPLKASSRTLAISATLRFFRVHPNQFSFPRNQEVILSRPYTLVFAGLTMALSGAHLRSEERRVGK